MMCKHSYLYKDLACYRLQGNIYLCLMVRLGFCFEVGLRLGELRLGVFFVSVRRMLRLGENGYNVRRFFKFIPDLNCLGTAGVKGISVE